MKRGACPQGTRETVQGAEAISRTLNWATRWQEVGQQQDSSVNTEPRRGLGNVGTGPGGWQGHQERAGHH